MSKDSIGDRMKENYERRAIAFLPRRAYTIIRVDGKAFHTFTRGMAEPFDDLLMTAMNMTAEYLCKNIIGAKFAFVQSDEISILLTDFDTLDTQAWFDNNLQKMVSVSASMATRAFNEYRQALMTTTRWAEFDSRVFQIPCRTEVANYFIWRQQDATRNSIFSAAQTLYSHNELHGVNTNEMQAKMLEKNVNWNDYPIAFKRGRVIKRFKDENERSYWTDVQDLPIFTQEPEFLQGLIPETD